LTPLVTVLSCDTGKSTVYDGHDLKPEKERIWILKKFFKTNLYLNMV